MVSRNTSVARATHLPTGVSVCVDGNVSGYRLADRAKRVLAVRLAAARSAPLAEVFVYELPDDNDCPNELLPFRRPSIERLGA